jgi:hypothetical protein
MASKFFSTSTLIFFKKITKLDEALLRYRSNLALMASLTGAQRTYLGPNSISKEISERRFQLENGAILNTHHTHKGEKSENREAKKLEKDYKDAKKAHESGKAHEEGSEELTEHDREALRKAGKEAASAHWGKDYVGSEEENISEGDIKEARSKIGKMGAEKRWHHEEGSQTKKYESRDDVSSHERRSTAGKMGAEVRWERRHGEEGEEKERKAKKQESRDDVSLHEKRSAAGKMGAEVRWERKHSGEVSSEPKEKKKAQH